MTRACKLALIAAALAAVAAALIAPALSGAQSEHDLRNRAAQAQRVIDLVRAARADASSAVVRLAHDEARQRDITAAVQARRNALVAISASLQQRRAAVAQARAARVALLAATRAQRQRLEKRI